MQKFTQLTGVAAPMPMVNIDTDAIIPKQFLKTIKRTGLGKHLFNDLRYEADGKERASFVLNQTAYREAKILIAGANFGCGSSREHAPWALADFGIRCVVAPSFADIFFNNCFKNGLLPIILTQEQIDQLMALVQKPGTQLMIDLETQKISGPESINFAFTIEPFRRHYLLNGLDDISLTEQYIGDIKTFEDKRKTEQPWV